MTIYTAQFGTDADYAERTFKAKTAEQALALARTFYDSTAENCCSRTTTAAHRS